MLYNSEELERNAVLHAAELICAAARTAPKAKGIDVIRTAVLTDADKDALADAMERIGTETGAAFFIRDAGNVRAAQAVVLIGAEEQRRALNELCGYCHHKNCAECTQADGVCAMDAVDVGIAIGSACAAAADLRVDNRVMFSVGRAARDMRLLGEDVRLVFGLPLSVAGKNVFFDRKKK